MRIHSGIIYTTWVTTGAFWNRLVYIYMILSHFSISTVFCILTFIRGICAACLSLYPYICVNVHLLACISLPLFRYLYRWRSMMGYESVSVSFSVNVSFYVKPNNIPKNVLYVKLSYWFIYFMYSVVLVYCHFIFTIECANKNGEKLYENCLIYLSLNRQQRGVNKSI